MGKIVKYCSACEESFAEKFAFCPNCAQPMTAFEMNPVSGGATEVGANAKQTIAESSRKPIEDEKPSIASPASESVINLTPKPAVAAPKVAQTAPKVETPKAGETKVSAASNRTQNYNLADLEELKTIDEPKAKEPVKEKVEKAVPPAKTFAAAAGANGSDNRQSNYRTATKDDDGFHITVIEEKNTKQRNGLLLGTMVVMIFVALVSAVVSIFNKDYDISSIGADSALYLSVNDAAPVEVEKEEPPKPEKEKGGGGGGGGREESEPASKGRLVSQVEKPIDPPDAKLPQLTNPELKKFQTTQGKEKIRPITEERAGLPGSDNLTASNGPGRGGGLGSGQGTGLGGGIGTGEGNGRGSGSGNGDGSGNGNGSGPGGNVPPPPAPKAPSGPPTPINIISKPQPRYTDAARTNNVTGTVTLKVTFMANGTIGSVSPVSGLPYGLTEQAIAAAKSIRFDPPKRGGVPYSVSKTITYNFTIY